MSEGRVIAWYYIEADPVLWLFADPLDMDTWPKATIITIWEGEPVNPLDYLIENRGRAA